MYIYIYICIHLFTYFYIHMFRCMYTLTYRLKNSATQVRAALKDLKVDFSVLLTGTPIQVCISKILLYYTQGFLVFWILKECSWILWATVILDGNFMHISFIYICISERHKSNIYRTMSRNCSLCWTSCMKRNSVIKRDFLLNMEKSTQRNRYEYYICLYIYIYAYIYICMHVHLYIGICMYYLIVCYV
jgi:hypothetical protein